MPLPNDGAPPINFDPFAGPALARTAPSTESQRELWTAARMGEDASCAFNESATLELAGPIDLAALRAAVTDLVARHEALRTTFSADGETLYVAERATVEVPLVDLAAQPEDERESRLAAIFAEEVEKPFALDVGPLIRFRVVRLAPEKHLFVFTAHHCVVDGFSAGVIVRDLGALYTARRLGQPDPLKPATAFTDYAAELLTRQGTAEHGQDENFWVDRFKQLPPPLDLPWDRPRPRLKSYPSRRFDHRLSRETVAALKKTGAKSGASFFVTLLTAFDVLLYRLSGQDDLVVGIPAAGQAATGHQDLVGHCVNTLPIRVSLDGTTSFASSLGRVRTAMLDAQEHQLYTFGSLLRALSVPRDPSRLPLVSVFFNLDIGLAPETMGFDGAKVSFFSNPRHFENFDLFVNAVELAGEVTLEAQFNTDLLDEATVRRWFEVFDRILFAAAEKPDLALDRVDIVSAEDLRRYASVNETHRDYPRDRLVHELVEAQVDRTPDAVAVVAGSQTLTFRELDRRANQLAHHLRALGAKPEVKIGIALERTVEMIVALLAVHKSGAAYVPLDPAFPAERLAFMVADSGMSIVVTQRSLRSVLPHHEAEVVEIDGDADTIARCPVERPKALAREALAYVIYTSGSTGKPKGVELPVSAMVNLLWSVRSEPGLTATDRIVAVTTLSFDIAVFDLWLPLVVGARIYLATRDVAQDGMQLRKLVESSGCTMMQATPASWRLLLGAGWEGGRGFKAICTGEALPPDLADLLVARTELWNMYGPTETTVWSTLHKVPRPPGPILIGKPIANTLVHVLDKHGQRVPVGVIGELYLGGHGVARGYLNRPDLTAERFLPDPFSTEPGARMYRTGDTVRMRPDGNIDFLGRNDGQVKVRGYRIELGEIDTALSRHATVAQAVTRVREDRPGDVRLVSYVVLKPDSQFSEQIYRDHLRLILPEYMVPQHIVRLDAMPLTPSGKVDRKALPAPDLSSMHAEEYVPPRTETEQMLAQVWQEALGVSRVGLHDDFFALGGHSLLAAQVIARLSREHGITLPMRKLFEAPTVAKFAPLLSADRPKVKIPRLPEGARSPVSFMQQRIWNLEQLQPGRAVFNVPAAFRLLGDFDLAAFQRSLDALVARHESARTTLRPYGDGQVEQVVADDLHLPVEVVDMQQVPAETREARLMELLQADTAMPFDLVKGPLIRTRVYKLGPKEHVAYFTPHHTIWDGWSFDILVRDWSELYAAEIERRAPKLPELTVRYRDFAAWHSDWLRTADLSKQTEYWRTHLAGEIPSLELPTDRPRTRTRTDSGDTLWVEITRAEADGLAALGQRYGATLYMVMLAAFETVLHRWSGQTDILVGTPIRGRELPEIEDVVGTFINTLVLRTRFDGDPSFAELLARVRTAVMGGFAHGDLPFEDLTLSHKPIFRALFSFQDARGRPGRFGNLEIKQLHILPPVAANEVNLWIMEKHAGLAGGLNFATDFFDVETMKRFLASFQRVLQGVVADPERPVSRLPLAEDHDRSVQANARQAAAPLPTQALVRAAAAKPSEPALLEGQRTLTRAELAAAAIAVATRLKAAGVGPGDRVGLLAGATADGVIAALGIAWLGAVCVPLDPSDPPRRLGQIAGASRPRLVLAPGGKAEGLPPGINVLPLVAPGPAAGDLTPATDGGVLLHVADPRGGLAAVDLSLSALASAAEGAAHLLNLREKTVLLCSATPAQGEGLLLPWLALIAGGKLVMAGEGGDDPEHLKAEVARTGANVLWASPWTWGGLLEGGFDSGASFVALCSGTPPVALGLKLAARPGLSAALHGSAETGVWDAVGRIGVDGTCLLTPLPGVELAVVDLGLQPLPRGIRGEVLVGGATVARSAGREGVLVSVPEISHEPLVRTAEQGAIRVGGLQVMGRMDAQLSLRGRRVEPAEVERVLASHPAVAEVAVATREDNLGEARLVAYVVRRKGQDATGTELRSYCRELLPDFAIPRQVMELDELPVVRGEVDRAALPSPFREPIDLAATEPRNGPERLLADLWREALAVHRVGRNDNFFDLGGHSLLCLQLVAEVEKRTGKRLSPRLFLLNTLEQVAAQLPAGDRPTAS